MEDDDGLELSLSLTLGGSSGKSKAKAIVDEHKVEESSNVGVSAADAQVASFFQKNANSQESGSKHAADAALNPGQGIDIGKSTINPQFSQPAVFHQDKWVIKNAHNQEREQQGSSKRRALPEEMNNQKKSRATTEQPEVVVKNEPISISTDEGSTGENDDAAESEAEGSNTWLVAQPEDSTKGSGINMPVENRGAVEPDEFSFHKQKQPCLSGSESSSIKAAYGASPAPEVPGAVNFTYPHTNKVAGAPTVLNSLTNPPILTRSHATSDLPTLQVISDDQTAFGYSTLQLPTLESSSPWAFGMKWQKSFASSTESGHGDGEQNADDTKKPRGTAAVQDPRFVLTSLTPVTSDTKLEPTKAASKPGADAASSSSANAEDEAKAINAILFQQKENPNQPVGPSLSHTASAIKPGILSDLKFGGTGSYPDLPWVSTTGSGPKGRTISGVAYKHGKNQLKIVCACHGIHLSPLEFVQHASLDNPGQENELTASAFPLGQQAASAQNSSAQS